MKIDVHGWHTGSYREVGFTDADNEEIVAYSGLLGPTEAAELAGQLRDLANELVTWAQGDDERQLQLFDVAA